MNTEDENNDDVPKLTFRFNLFKFNICISIIILTLSFFKEKSDFLTATIDSLLVIQIYTNIVILYILFKSLKTNE
jgi:hypothetical protein